MRRISNNLKFKKLGFKSIRRKQGDEYFYNNDISNRSLAKLFKKYGGKAHDAKATNARMIQKASILLKNKPKKNDQTTLQRTKPVMPESPTKVIEVKPTIPKETVDKLSMSPKSKREDENDREVFDEVSSCLDMLRNIEKKMSKYQAADRSINDKFDDLIKNTTAVNDLASESHHNYKVATKKDLLRKDLEIEHL